MAFGFGLKYILILVHTHICNWCIQNYRIEYKRNFTFPYSSISSTEFWRRWHISLSSWVADYLYKFLNKNLPIYFYGSIPLLFTWGIMGLWHDPLEDFLYGLY